MSEIDQYKYECIGVVECPSDYDIALGVSHCKNIPLYRILECAEEWDAKEGDLLLGGGSGESAVFRIRTEAAIKFFTNPDFFANPNYDGEYIFCKEFVKAYWTPTETYIFGNGYIKMGWNPAVSRIENWLTEHIVAFLIKHYQGEYGHLMGDKPVKESGDIFSLPFPPYTYPIYHKGG